MAIIPAPARANTTQIALKAESLGEALQDVARQSGVDLLFDHNAVAGIQAQPLTATLTPEAAIAQLIQGTTLTLRQAASGAFIVEQSAPPPLARQDVPVPEILVIGRRSQNADIRRLETDIQPYRVTTGREIIDADRDNLDQYFRSQVTSDTDAVPPSLTANGTTNSQIDLRGLGSDQTLVLIDGRRMPSIPAPIFGFQQTDINAVPLYAIDRTETLTGTAGGIYGFGALGGVVNVVLAHPSHGIEMHVTGGISARGDAGEHRLEGDAGFSADDRTEISLHASLSESQPLLYGQRTFLSDDTKLTASASPTSLLPFISNGNSVLVENFDEQNLVLKPQFGGGTAGSSYTFLPAGLSGAPAEVAAALIQNAGKFDSSLPEGTSTSGIGSNPRTESLLANVHHQFDSGVEAYLDAVMLWDQGESLNHGGTGTAFLLASSPLNPFTQNVQIEFPVPGGLLDRKTEFFNSRYTAGVIAPLPFDWRATAEVALGEARYQFSQVQVTYSPPFPSPDPPAFGNWTSFQSSLAGQLVTDTSSERITNNLRDLSLRLAGPVFKTQGGPATLTLVGERRTEDVPGYTNFGTGPYGSTISIAGRKTATTSVYAELRTKLFGEAQPVPLLRNFEIQLAIRNDTETDDFAQDPQDPDTTQRLHARFSGTVYTVGAKLSPVSWLSLRGSYATGETAPPLADLIEMDEPNVGFVPADDPKRPGTIVQNLLLKNGGNPGLQTIKANTASFGGILTPLGDAGPRFTVDYSRIRKTGDVFIPSAQLVLTNETFWPQRVVRGPLTAADQARGFTAGPIIMLDTRAENGAGLKADTIEGRIDWLLPFYFGGNLRLYSDATYYLRNVQTAPFQADLERVDYLDEPLRVRANAGAIWELDSLTFGINVQYFGSYRIIPPATAQFAATTAIALQGSEWVPSQTYADLHISWRHHLYVGNSSEDVRIDFGVINIFDKEPPRESSYSLDQYAGPQIGLPGVSRYGDPRLRRFLLTLSVAM